MFHYKLLIAYSGTHYFGWQAQTSLPSVSSEISKTFEKIFSTPCKVKGVSRTDAGVHALGQVALLKTEIIVDPERLKFALNNRLPADILIRSAEIASDDFDLYDDVTQKIYQYHFFQNRPLPMMAPYGWHVRHDVDEQKLRDSLHLFVGTHDFASFRCQDDQREDTVRTIQSIDMHYFRRYDVYRVTVVGHTFMRHMIRRMVGAAMSIAISKKRSSELIMQAFEEKNARQELINAPAQGLLLYKVRYKR